MIEGEIIIRIAVIKLSCLIKLCFSKAFLRSSSFCFYNHKHIRSSAKLARYSCCEFVKSFSLSGNINYYHQ